MTDWLQILSLTPIHAQELRAFCIEAMRRCGLREDAAEITAEVLVATDLWGIHTHGSKQLHPLLKLRPDRMDPQAVPDIISQGPAWSLVDGHYAIAPFVATRTMEHAIARAKACGIGFAGARNSNHFGAAAYYANMAARQGMIGIAMTNVNPLVVVPGGRTPVIGTNPIAYAVPAGDEKPVFLDIATSVVAASKVIVAKALGQLVPDNWIVDTDGLPTTDPSDYPEKGALWPMAGHKGYGLALLIEVISGVLTGAQVLDEVKLWLADHPGPLSQGHAFIVIDVASFMPPGDFGRRMDQVIREIRESPKAKGSDRIYLPGEMEWEKWEVAVRDGMLLPPDAIQRLQELAMEFDLDMGQLVRRDH